MGYRIKAHNILERHCLCETYTVHDEYALIKKTKWKKLFRRAFHSIQIYGSTGTSL